jgi:hypothetical protein
VTIEEATPPTGGVIVFVPKTTSIPLGTLEANRFTGEEKPPTEKTVTVVVASEP